MCINVFMCFAISFSLLWRTHLQARRHFVSVSVPCICVCVRICISICICICNCACAILISGQTTTMTENRDRPTNKQTNRTNRQKRPPLLCDLLNPVQPQILWPRPRPLANARQKFFVLSCSTKLDKYTWPLPLFGRQSQLAILSPLVLWSFVGGSVVKAILICATTEIENCQNC